MSDYISRDAAISHPFANGKYDHEHANEAFICGYESYKEWLEALPSADVVERKRGKWIKSRRFAYTRYTSIFNCSECNKSGKSNYNYCPNCGAKMEVEGHDA